MSLACSLLHQPNSQFCTFPPRQNQRWRPRIQGFSCSSTPHHLLHGPFVEGDLDKPRWSGDEPLARFVSGLISIKPLFALMKAAARQVLISSAEKNGIPWRQMTEQYLASDIYAEKELIENTSVVYPDYYLQDFHGYRDGNLSWKAAAEAEAATSSIVIRAVPAAQSLKETESVLRGNWLKTIENHHQKYSGGQEIMDILDVGCSVGVSTRSLADRFPSAQVTGLDLSPYFLAVAQHKDKQQATMGSKREKAIRWLHAKGEETGLLSASFDVVSIAYVLHECSEDATRALIQEAFRLLRPGGTLAVTDLAPKSKVIQNLPPVLFTLMKSTEPWIDVYYSINLEEVMHGVGFKHVNAILTDPRHKTTTATVPL